MIATPPSRPESFTDRLYDIGFFLVEAFASLEVTAVIVANSRITESLGLPEELSSYIINSYLYPLFAVMLLILLLSRQLSRTFNPLRFFLVGLVMFAAGNLICFSAPTPFRFFTGRGIMGVGAAISFAGQLWTLTFYHRHRITRTLIWGEAGAALGVVAGPIVGALFAQFSPEGWRDFFLLKPDWVWPRLSLPGWVSGNARIRRCSPPQFWVKSGRGEGSSGS